MTEGNPRGTRPEGGSGMTKGNPIRIGTRKSPLAMAQAEWIADRIKRQDPSSAVELVGIVTEGDRASESRGKWKGGKGIFVKALDDALLKKTIDLAVHSAKDVPTALPAGLSVAAIPVREDVGDLLVSREGWTIQSMPLGTRVGTSALRRAAQMCFIRPDIEIIPIRGNVQTRLGKIGAGCDAAIVAAAGVNRLGGMKGVLGKMDLKGVRLDPAEFLPAPGQAALMVVSRKEDVKQFSFLTDPATASAVRAERALVEFLGADCSWPIGAWARMESGRECVLDAAIFSVEGKLRVRESAKGTNGEEMARELAGRLLEKGGKKILDWNMRRQEP